MNENHLNTFLLQEEVSSMSLLLREEEATEGESEEKSEEKKKGFFRKLIDGVIEFFKNLFANIKKAVDWVIQKVTGAFDRIKGFIFRKKGPVEATEEVVANVEGAQEAQEVAKAAQEVLKDPTSEKSKSKIINAKEKFNKVKERKEKAAESGNTKKVSPSQAAKFLDVVVKGVETVKANLNKTEGNAKTIVGKAKNQDPEEGKETVQAAKEAGVLFSQACSFIFGASRKVASWAASMRKKEATEE